MLYLQIWKMLDENDRITAIMNNFDIRSNMPDDCPEKVIFFVRSEKQTLI